MVRNRPHVIEELTKEIPATFALHDIDPKHQVAGALNGILEEKFRSSAGVNVAEAFVVEENQRSLIPPRWAPNE